MQVNKLFLQARLIFTARSACYGFPTAQGYLHHSVTDTTPQDQRQLENRTQ